MVVPADKDRAGPHSSSPRVRVSLSSIGPRLGSAVASGEGVGYSQDEQTVNRVQRS